MASLEDLAPEARDELALLARSMAENPETRAEFLRMTKKVKPGLPIPEIEIADATAKQVEAANERVRALEAKLQERDAVSDLEKARAKLLKSGKVQSEAEIEAVEKLMLEKGINSHETAADFYRLSEANAAAPAGPSYDTSVFNRKTQDMMAPFWKNPKMAARNAAAEALAELRQPRRPIGL